MTVDSDVKYPDIHVQLSSEDGNSFFIIGRVMGSMRRAGISEEVRKEFSDEAMSGDYDHLLRTCMRWVSVS